ncbi:hypothetical protein [Sandaracinus amylolyticus]|uniref:hypothetical protein n=1 Tax=Sandaracinus amylolyticus TaxID=927083 RepID=UPI001F3B45BD|nr:hypothetical protein [Sandaracinus amylolyticus]UJR87162.1 Hypothetical protein I5071_92630 [Sandaracinus amylolyticus]
MRRGWLSVVTLAVLACGGETGAVEPVSPGEAAPARAVTPDPEVEAATAWARAAPGRDDAAVQVVERSGAGDALRLHVIACDGDVTLDTWLARSWPRTSEPHWDVAALVAAVQRAHVDTLLGSGGRRLVTIDGATWVCPDAEAAPCLELAAPRRASSLWCDRGGAACTMWLDGDAGRLETWRLEDERRRRTGSALQGVVHPARGGMRAERGRWETLVRAPERPPALRDAALAPSRDVDDERCEPTVRSVREGDVVVRAVSCGDVRPWTTVWWPSALVITRAGRTTATPIFDVGLGPPEPLRVFDVAALAPGALGVVIDETDGGSPSGAWREALWVITDTPHGLRHHALTIAAGSTLGLGTEDEREGYVVAVDRTRATLEVSGPGAARFVECERWSGTHARVSGRWNGEHHVEPLDVQVRFDPERGFELSEGDRAQLEQRCGI